MTEIGSYSGGQLSRQKPRYLTFNAIAPVMTTIANFLDVRINKQAPQ